MKSRPSVARGADPIHGLCLGSSTADDLRRLDSAFRRKACRFRSIRGSRCTESNSRSEIQLPMDVEISERREEPFGNSTSGPPIEGRTADHFGSTAHGLRGHPTGSGPGQRRSRNRERTTLWEAFRNHPLANDLMKGILR
jgi:hypothetical protein